MDFFYSPEKDQFTDHFFCKHFSLNYVKITISMRSFSPFKEIFYIMLHSKFILNFSISCKKRNP